MVGSRNNCQQTKYTPKILTCGVAYLVKEKRILWVYMCVGENANERKGYKQNNVYTKF
jgi:hypothetical protein